MNTVCYPINNRDYTLLSPLVEEECLLQRDKNYLFDLSYLGMIQVSGDRAADYLQGQQSCDIRLVTDTMIQQGCFCNLKGRLLALVDLVNWYGYRMILPKDLIPGMLASLSKTAMVSRVQLQENSDFRIFGLYLSNRETGLPLPFRLPTQPYAATYTEEAFCYAIDEACFIILMNKNKTHDLLQAFAMQELRGSLAWHRLQLERQNVQIYHDTVSLFLPHRLDLHKKGYLNFEKGCFKGQEIIARTHYRAKLKHGLQNFLIKTQEPIMAGKKLFDPNTNQEVGELVDYCPLSKDTFLIVVSILNEHPLSVLIEGHATSTLLI
jgi:folate-binding protein YgfZ